MTRIIVALSGGKASAWCAEWALKNYPKDSVILYFNDTKWEHPDLYRFLEDISNYYNHPILSDSDGRSVEELAYDEHAIPSNMMPFCSRILKGKRLQEFYQTGDQLVFGIGLDERRRCERIIKAYDSCDTKQGKCSSVRFPIIENMVTDEDINMWLLGIGIEEPILYRLGFKHNNCSGGCVRSGKRQWIQLLRVLPDVYAERERFEMEFREHFGRGTILKDTTLEQLRVDYRKQIPIDFPEEFEHIECMGICDE